MPVQPTYPGVYVEELPSGVRTITGVATSIAAFFGQAKEGPVNKAVRVLSFADFQRTFGPPHPSGELSTAVRLFFQNGGIDCYVVRLVKEGTGSKASVVVKTEPSVAGDPFNLVDILRFSAKEIGVWGNQLALEVDYNTARPEDSFHLKIYRLADDGSVQATEQFLNLSMDPDSPAFPPARVTQESKLVDCEHVFADDTAYKTLAASVTGYSESRRVLPSDTGLTNSAANRVHELAGIIAVGSETTRFRISVDGSAFFEVDLEDAFSSGASEVAALGAIKTRIDQALPSALQDTVTVTMGNGPGTRKVLRFTSNTTEQESIVVQPAPSKDVTATLMLGTDNGGVERSKYAVLRPGPTGISFNMSNLNPLANHPQNYFTAINLDGNTIDLQNNLQTTGAADLWWEGRVDATTKNSDGVREKLAIMAKAINDEGIGWTATVAGSRLLVKKKSGPTHASAAFATSVGNNIGPYFNTNTRYYSLGSGTGTFYGTVVAGVEGDPPDPKSYKGSEEDHTGFYALDEADLFNLMIIPKDTSLTEDNYRSLWGPASVYCASRRAFLIIDPPDSWADSYQKLLDPSKGIRQLRIGVQKDHSAVFYPKIVVRNNGLLKPVGPGGAIAGLMARIDANRGVWKAPAGIEADLRTISGLDLKLTDMENGVLNKKGVNCLRVFPSGVVNWGARTLDGDDDFGSEWKYIPVRRLALNIEESLFRGTKWVVFEPNDEPLWAKIRLNVGAYMMSLFRQGAFQGTDPKDAFYVKCDKETTTQDDINKGIVNIEVGFAPLKPAEFVVIKIQQMAGEL